MLSFLIGTAMAAEGHDVTHEGAAFPPFDVTTFTSQVFWLAIFFGVLYLLMSRVALPRVAGILEDRATTIARDLDQAAAMQGKAQEAGVAYEAALAKARSSAIEIGQKAKDAANAEVTERRKAVESDAAGRIAAAEAQIGATKAAAMSNVAGIAAEAASAIVEQIAGKAPSKAELEAAVSAAAKF